MSIAVSNISRTAEPARWTLPLVGVGETEPEHVASVVMYELNEHGEPAGKPIAFDYGNPNMSCDTLAIHYHGRHAPPRQ